MPAGVPTGSDSFNREWRRLQHQKAGAISLSETVPTLDSMSDGDMRWYMGESASLYLYTKQKGMMFRVQMTKVN